MSFFDSKIGEKVIKRVEKRSGQKYAGDFGSIVESTFSERGGGPPTFLHLFMLHAALSDL